MTGLRRVDSLAARCLMSRGRNKRAMVSRQKQEYQRQSRDVNNTRQGSRSQAQVQSSKVGQSGVKHRDSRMNRRTLRNVTRGKQDFALGECLYAAFMWVREWGAGVVRQSELMSEWWQLCDWCNGGRECVSAVHDGKCSPWVMCSLSEWEPDSWQYVFHGFLSALVQTSATISIPVWQTVLVTIGKKTTIFIGLSVSTTLCYWLLYSCTKMLL